MGKRKFSDLQIEFVKNNYPEFGAKYCAEKLGLSNEQVRRMANHRNITLLPQTKEEILLSRCPDNDRNVPTQQFINVKTPEVSYILGILWAECWLNKLQYGISFSILEDDYNDIDYLINDVGQWNKYYRQRVGRRPSVTVSMYSKVLYNFFWELGMYPHSVESASKLINIVPNKFKHIWWAGYFDGDGSIYAS